MTRRLRRLENGPVAARAGAGPIAFLRHLGFTGHRTVAPVAVALLAATEAEPGWRWWQGRDASLTPRRILE